MRVYVGPKCISMVVFAAEAHDRIGVHYADYSVQQMYDVLSGYRLTRDIGSQYEYSIGL
jgi:hypothetical protein